MCFRTVRFILTPSALTYVDIDDDTDSLDVGTDTPPTSAHPTHGGRMPQVETPKPAETAEDAALSPKEEEKPVPGNVLSCLVIIYVI